MKQKFKLWTLAALTLATVNVVFADDGNGDEYQKKREQLMQQVNKQAESRFVPQGYTGYAVLKPCSLLAWCQSGGYDKCIKGPATYSYPIIHGVYIVPISTQPDTFTEPFEILTKDKNLVDFRVHLILQVKDDTEATIRDVVEHNGGQNWYEQIVREKLRTFVREAVDGYEAFDLNNNETRHKIQDKVKADIEQYLSGKPFTVVSISVGAMQYKKELTDAIEKTLVAKQIALQKIEELKVQKNENEILVERAKGAALVQEERSKHLTPLLVQQQAVEALSKMAENPNKTTIIFIPVGSGGLPVIDAGQVLNAVQKQMDGHPVQAEAKK